MLRPASKLSDGWGWAHDDGWSHLGGNKVDKKNPTVSCGSADGSWHANNVGHRLHRERRWLRPSQTASDASFNLSTAVACRDGRLERSRPAATTSATGVGHTVTAGPITGNKIDPQSTRPCTCGST